MPIGQIIGELVAQTIMEAGGEVIHKKFGWKGCLTAIAIIVGMIASVILLIQ